jgi:hypothetical protein
MDSRSTLRSAGMVRQANFNNTSASQRWMRRGARPAVLRICTLSAHAKRWGNETGHGKCLKLTAED